MSRRGRRFLAWVFSVAAHLMVFAALFWPHAAFPPPRADPPPVLISLVTPPNPQPPGPVNPAKAGGAQNAARPAPPHLAAPVPVMVAANTPAPDASDLVPDTSDLLNESQLAGAASTRDGGGGGGNCDTARAVQQALRRDPLVRIAVEDAHRLGKAVMLWNGDWVRSGEQDGKGLSAVREAIIWEVAFAPEACRNQRIHGLVLLSLADGGTRFAIGAGDWRWSDLLGARTPYR